VKNYLVEQLNKWLVLFILEHHQKDHFCLIARNNKESVTMVELEVHKRVNVEMCLEQEKSKHFRSCARKNIASLKFTQNELPKKVVY
jgi:hypothetical protein